MKSLKKIYFPFLIMFVAAACSVSKDVTVSKTSLPDSYRNATSTDTQSIATIPWNHFIEDTTLQVLIKKAIEQNFDMQIALKNIKSAQLQLTQAKWGNVPTVNLNVTGSTSRPSDNSLNGLSLGSFLGTKHIEDYSANLSLSWEADIWGKIRSQKKAALAAYLQSEEATKAIQTELVASVSKDYYNLQLLDAQIQIAKRNLALNDSTLTIVKLQYEAGQVTSLAVQQTEALRLEAAQLVPALEQEINIQENALSILTGETPKHLDRALFLNHPNYPAELPTGIPSEMVSNRPDVHFQELSLSIANAKVGVAKASLYPSLTITAVGGVNAFKASNWFNIPASLFGTLAGGISQPLLMHKQLKTQFEIAKVEREKSVLQFRQSVLTAVGEVSDALVRIDKLKEQETIADAKVRALHQAIENANLLFQNGMANYLEVITANSKALQSELDLSTLKRDQLFAVVDLYKSLGGGWK